MTRLLKFLIAATVLQFALVTGAFAAEEIGKAIAVTVTVTGDDGPLSASSAIHRDERVRTSSSGTGQFVFRDGTKLAVGPNSSLVLDQSIFSGSSSFKKLTLNATRGTFRWVSGKSTSAAYKINTPFGTLGFAEPSLISMSVPILQPSFFSKEKQLFAAMMASARPLRAAVTLSEPIATA